jgi:Ca2+-binding EF-hand superfamily protein
VRDALSQLKKVFQVIHKKTNKTTADIFADITDFHSETVKIRDFVLRLTVLDSTLKADDLFKLCTVLDKDNNGIISLDEFLLYF